MVGRVTQPLAERKHRCHTGLALRGSVLLLPCAPWLWWVAQPPQPPGYGVADGPWPCTDHIPTALRLPPPRCHSHSHRWQASSAQRQPCLWVSRYQPAPGAPASTVPWARLAVCHWPQLYGAKVRPLLAHNGDERQVALARLGDLATRKHPHAVGIQKRHTTICGSKGSAPRVAAS
jgi:hypothetical protein